MTSRRRYKNWKRGRRAVSPVIAELLLIVITVALGTLVYSFASTAFGGFGSGFSNLVQSAGQQLQENLVIEQVYFFNNVNGSASCASFSHPSVTCGGVLFVRNVGGYSVTLLNIYMANLSSSSQVGFTTVAGSAVTPNPSCLSNTMAAKTVCFTVWDPGNLQYDDADVLATGSSLVIGPGQVAEIHFVLPVFASTPACTAGNPQDCVVAHGGTVYSFTIVTSRGNQFFADAKA